MGSLLSGQTLSTRQEVGTTRVLRIYVIMLPYVLVHIIVVALEYL